MFPQFGPQQGPQVSNGYTTSPMLQQNNSLLGVQPFSNPNAPVDFNTTAPSSSNMHPAVQNMVKALKGGL